MTRSQLKFHSTFYCLASQIDQLFRFFKLESFRQSIPFINFLISSRKYTELTFNFEDANDLTHFHKSKKMTFLEINFVTSVCITIFLCFSVYAVNRRSFY